MAIDPPPDIVRKPQSEFFKVRITDHGELSWMEIRARASIGAGLLMRHLGDPKAINKLARLAVSFDDLRHNETAKAMTILLKDAAGGPFEPQEDCMEISDQTIYSAAPLFFRLRTEGYFDPEDEMPADILAIRTELGLPAFVQERRYPPIHYWGIECPDAWFEIVLDAATKLEALLHDMLKAGIAVDDLPACVQIKEKFGGLRIYWQPVEAAPFTQAMRDALAQAQARVLRLQRRVQC